MRNFVDDPLGVIRFLFTGEDCTNAFKWILHSKDYDVYRKYYREIYPYQVIPSSDIDTNTLLRNKIEYITNCLDTLDYLRELQIKSPETVLLVSDLFLKPVSVLKDLVEKHGSSDVSWIIDVLMDYYDSAMLHLTEILMYDNLMEAINKYSDTVYFELIE